MRYKPKTKRITEDYIACAIPNYHNKGFPTPKWLQFCWEMIKRGWDVELYASKTTVSKYLWVTKDGKELKVRFSNHKAAKYREEDDDSDFYVGVGNRGVITTEQVIDKIVNQ